jgi:hypothetical protein
MNRRCLQNLEGFYLSAVQSHRGSVWGAALRFIWVQVVNDHRVDRAGGSEVWVSGMANRRIADGMRAGFGMNEGRADLPKSCARGK